MVEGTLSKTNPQLNLRSEKKLVFVWENFGPTHDDRCLAVVRNNTSVDVFGLQLAAHSSTYEWQSQPAVDFKKITLFKKANRRLPRIFTCAGALLRTLIKVKATHVFLCHYEDPAIAIAAIILRLLGKRVFLLYDSKFDDYPRFLWREVFKSFWLRPYHGAIVGSERSKDYLRFLGLQSACIHAGYDTISLERIRRLSNAPPAPDGCPFQARHFTIIARLVEKKNLATILKAYALYANQAETPRPLRIFGAGPMEAVLREEVKLGKIQHLVCFEGFQQTENICRALSSSLAVLLVSREEQFGFAIVEALAMGVPVLISPACGAHDEFVRNGVNGFVVESDNPQGMAFFMSQLGEDELLWRNLAEQALIYAEKADVAHFAKAVDALTSI